MQERIRFVNKRLERRRRLLRLLESREVDYGTIECGSSLPNREEATERADSGAEGRHSCG